MLKEFETNNFYLSATVDEKGQVVSFDFDAKSPNDFDLVEPLAVTWLGNPVHYDPLNENLVYDLSPWLEKIERTEWAKEHVKESPLPALDELMHQLYWELYTIEQVSFA